MTAKITQNSGAVITCCHNIELNKKMHTVEDPRIFDSIVYTGHVQENILSFFLLSTDN